MFVLSVLTRCMLGFAVVIVNNTFQCNYYHLLLLLLLLLLWSSRYAHSEKNSFLAWKTVVISLLFTAEHQTNGETKKKKMK